MNELDKIAASNKPRDLKKALSKYPKIKAEIIKNANDIGTSLSAYLHLLAREGFTDALLKNESYGDLNTMIGLDLFGLTENDLKHWKININGVKDGEVSVQNGLRLANERLKVAQDYFEKNYPDKYNDSNFNNDVGILAYYSLSPESQYAKDIIEGTNVSGLNINKEGEYVRYRYNVNKDGSRKLKQDGDNNYRVAYDFGTEDYQSIAKEYTLSDKNIKSSENNDNSSPNENEFNVDVNSSIPLTTEGFVKWMDEQKAMQKVNPTQVTKPIEYKAVPGTERYIYDINDSRHPDYKEPIENISVWKRISNFVNKKALRKEMPKQQLGGQTQLNNNDNDSYLANEFIKNWLYNRTHLIDKQDAYKQVQKMENTPVSYTKDLKNSNSNKDREKVNGYNGRYVLDTDVFPPQRKIIINSGRYLTDDWFSTLIHEKAHALGTYKSQHPQISEGQKNNYLKDGVSYHDYLDGLDEIYSRLMQFRYKNKLSPKKTYTIDDFKQLEDNAAFGRYTDDFILHLLNNVAQNNNQQNEPNEFKAQYGGQLNNKNMNKFKHKEGGIYIKPENKGKFNATKERTGKTTEELTHSKNPLTKKRAIFAQNASKWKHSLGGDMAYANYHRDGLSLVNNKFVLGGDDFLKYAAGGLAIANPAEAIAQDKANYAKALERGEAIEGIINTVSGAGAMGMNSLQGVAGGPKSTDLQATKDMVDASNATAGINPGSAEINTDIDLSHVADALASKKKGGKIDLFDQFLLESGNAIIAEKGEIKESKYGTLSKVHGREHKMSNDQPLRPDGSPDGEVIKAQTGDFIYPSTVNQTGYIDKGTKGNPSFAQQRESIEKEFIPQFKKLNSKFKRVENSDLPINRNTQSRLNLQQQNLQSKHDERVQSLQDDVTSTKEQLEMIENMKIKAQSNNVQRDNEYKFKRGSEFIKGSLDELSNSELRKNVKFIKKNNPIQQYPYSKKDAKAQIKQNIKATNQANIQKLNNFADKYGNAGDLLSLANSINDLAQSFLGESKANTINPYTQYGREAENLFQNAHAVNNANFAEQKRDMAIARNTANRQAGLNSNSLNTQRALQLSNQEQLNETYRKANLDYLSAGQKIDEGIAAVKLKRDDLRMEQDIDNWLFNENMRANYLTQKQQERDNKFVRTRQMAKDLNDSKYNKSKLNYMKENKDRLKDMLISGEITKAVYDKLSGEEEAKTTTSTQQGSHRRGGKIWR